MSWLARDLVSWLRKRSTRRRRGGVRRDGRSARGHHRGGGGGRGVRRGAGRGERPRPGDASGHRLDVLGGRRVRRDARDVRGPHPRRSQRAVASAAPGPHRAPRGSCARLSLALRHARENPGGAKKSIPNIAWHSGSRWRGGSRNENVVRGADAVVEAPGSRARARRRGVRRERGGAHRSRRRGGAEPAVQRGEGVRAPRPAAASRPGEADESDARTASSTAAYRPLRKTDAFAREYVPLLTRRRRIAERWPRRRRRNDEQPPAGAAARGRRRRTTRRERRRRRRRERRRIFARLFAPFRLVLGADVVHERGMGDGVVRCLES